MFFILCNLLLVASSASPTGYSSSCDKFAASYRPQTSNVTVINSTHIDTGDLNITGVLNTVPFCRLFAEVSYPENNKVVFEVWMPDKSHHNGRYVSIGDGGLAGTIDEQSLMKDVNEGFAAAGGDSGHRASDNNNGVGGYGVALPFLEDKNQILAWIRNSVAYITPPAKSMVEAYYGEKPKKTYYIGCSTGGAQGFSLAQFYPDMFDGIVAGSPGNWYAHLILSFLWNSKSATGAGNMTQAQLNSITAAVIDQCDGQDGVKDGVVDNPLLCDFNIDCLACSRQSANATTCLSDAQLEAAKAIYRGPRNTITSEQIYPGFSVGSEAEWQGQEGPLASAYSISLLQNVVFDSLTYNDSSFNYGSDVGRVDQKLGSLIDAISPDLTAFASRGGKLIVTQGWSDPYNAAVYPMQHRLQIAEKTAGNIDDWYQLFMVPGGGHCGSASYYPQVPGNWRSSEQLVKWVETGHRPMEMLADTPADGSNTTRKLCPWPQVAKYEKGNPDEWTSYACTDC